MFVHVGYYSEDQGSCEKVERSSDKLWPRRFLGFVPAVVGTSEDGGEAVAAAFASWY